MNTCIRTSRHLLIISCQSSCISIVATYHHMTEFSQHDKRPDSMHVSHRKAFLRLQQETFEHVSPFDLKKEQHLTISSSASVVWLFKPCSLLESLQKSTDIFNGIHCTDRRKPEKKPPPYTPRLHQDSRWFSEVFTLEMDTLSSEISFWQVHWVESW